MGEEDGGSDRPKVKNSATRPNVYAAWTLKQVEKRDFRRRTATALQVDSLPINSRKTIGFKELVSAPWPRDLQTELTR